MTERFRVWIHFRNDTYHEETISRGALDAEAAINLAKDITLRPAVSMGIIARVFVTDQDDFTVFEWRHGLGVTFPTREMIEASKEGADHA